MDGLLIMDVSSKGDSTIASGMFFKARDILLKLLFIWSSLSFQMVCPFLFGGLGFFCLFFCLFVGSVLAMALAIRLSFLS
jgi:hypothetical protein